MKRRPLIAVAVTAAVLVTPLSTAGCSTSSRGSLATMSPSVPVTSSQLPSATAPTATEPAQPMTYSPQVVLPFGDLINHLSGVAVDAADNVYVTDSRTNRMLKLAAGATSPTVLPFTDLNGPSAVAVDTPGDVYVLDDGNFRVLKLPGH
jgi:DNA-binding beta-propeller fold protein YncE